MAFEIERKFLVDLDLFPFKLHELKKVEICQGYICSSPEENTVRLRQMGDTFFLTVKSQGLLVRKEYETEITRQQFDTLWPSIQHGKMVKTRYTFTEKHVEMTLDIFKYDLKGLQMIEAEFETEQEAGRFDVPDYCIKEVTHDPRYTNSYLSIHGLPNED